MSNNSESDLPLRNDYDSLWKEILYRKAVDVFLD